MHASQFLVLRPGKGISFPFSQVDDRLRAFGTDERVLGCSARFDQTIGRLFDAFLEFLDRRPGLVSEFSVDVLQAQVKTFQPQQTLNGQHIFAMVSPAPAH
jgi:hypothetical protein